jgi:hypothetical protein
MIVGIDEGRNDERPPRRRQRDTLGNGGDDTVVVPQHDIFKQAAVRTTEQPASRDFRGHDRDRVSKAFSSEADADSREENASNKR